MIFKIYNSDFGFKINGQSYEFVHVNSLAIDDPQMNRLTRGANAGNKVGLSYSEGVREPKKWTVEIMDMTADIKAVLDQAFEDQTRIDVYCVDRGNGSSKMGRNAVLTQQPQQLALNDSPDSLAVALAFETFDLTETFKE